ncbi:hypothetical protein CMI47_22995 [Candidatus Pacearchaeota archaeon]|jgi:hypothetical protein|nr:hypothetical protein [Candidatus Pacearchaeota archaeon]|tara:strand:- start:5100 stop:5975 length:876 start_codon:yes stop_codon:yes gene_type:complete
MSSLIKHLKIKNTGILFELLTRQVTADIMKDAKKSTAVMLIKKYFKESTELGQELQLYNVLAHEKFPHENQAERLIDAVIKTRTKLSNKKLKQEKYNLIKDIKDNYVISEFFSSRIPNYKLLASVYKVFGYTTEGQKHDPTDEVKSRFAIVEHIIRKKIDSSIKTNRIIEKYKKQDKDMRLLSYSILVDKFNTKYSSLNEEQQVLLKKYIENISNTNSLREFINNEVKRLTKTLKSNLKEVDDKVTTIKLKEATRLTKKMTNHKIVKDSDVVNLMRYYELVKEVKNVISKN